MRRECTSADGLQIQHPTKFILSAAMVYVMFLWMILKISMVQSADWPIKTKSIIDEDILLGGFFPIHGKDNDRMCGRIREEGLVELEAMLYTVDNINRDSSLLPWVRLGVVAVDSCDSVPKALEEAIDFAKGFIVKKDNHELNDSRKFQCVGEDIPVYQSGIYNKVVAIIGGHSSWVSMQVADLMRIYKIPQVSYQSTNPALSDQNKYQYFFRTVPPLQHQVEAILDILKEFGWMYVSVVYADSDYGNKGFENLKKLAPKMSICYSNPQRINVDRSSPKDYDFVVSNLLKSNAIVVIVFGDHEMARHLISAATRVQAYNKFVWIGSTAWVSREYVTSGNEQTMEGAIGITHDIMPLRNFDSYLRTRDLENHPKLNPWFPEYWEETMKCRLKNSIKTPFNQNYTNMCSPEDHLPTDCYTRATPAVQFVRDAVYAVAHALHDMRLAKCRKRRGKCSAFRNIDGEELREYLAKVEFEDESGKPFRFDSFGDGPPRYSVVNFQRNDITEEFRWISVGSYSYLSGNHTGLVLHKNKALYKDYQPSFPDSLCSTRCKFDQAKVILDDAKCCWHCTNCTEFQYVKNGTSCEECPAGTLPSIYKDGCSPIPEVSMDFTSAWAVGCVVFSVLGMVMTVFAAVIFAKYWDTAIFTFSGRELSLILLIGIFLSFSLTFAIVSKPSPGSCAIVRLCLGFFYTISYSVVCAKTRHISKLYHRQSANKKPKPVKAKPLLLMTYALIAVEGTINATWLLHSPPTTDHQYPTRKDNVFICKGSDTSGYLVGFVYPFLLVVFCTLYAFNLRDFTGAFYESRYINFTNYTTFIVWLAFLPMFLLNNINVLRVVVLSLLLNLSALIQLVCLFMPKVYIALRRPEKNKQEKSMCYDNRQSLGRSLT